MAFPTIPVIIPTPFAANGQKNVIPDTAATTPGAATAAWDVGFPAITMMPKAAGGKPPLGADFNGIFNALSQHLCYSQQGGVFPWNEHFDYDIGALVLGSDKSLYAALQQSGPSLGAGAKDPTLDGDEYWRNLSTESVLDRMFLCEVFDTHFSDLKPGFEPAQGGVIQDAVTKYPAAWAFLQTTRGSKRCCTEAEWQQKSVATWHTLADGTKVGFNGIGGVDYFVQDLNAGTLRLPDWRGMHREGIGGPGSPSLGEGVGDMSRHVTGGVVDNSGLATTLAFGELPRVSTSVYGCFTAGYSRKCSTAHEGTTYDFLTALYIDSSKVVPTGSVNRPRSIGVLPCVYLGMPR